MNLESFSVLAEPDVQLLFLRGTVTSLELFIISAAVAYTLGALLVMLRMSGRISSAAVGVFVEYHRNVPSIVQIFVWYFGVSQVLPSAWHAWANDHLGAFFYAVVALSLNAAAYISEDLRSGMRAVSNGQMEAARALGLNFLKAMQLVMVPQAIRAAAPALVNQALSLLKTTSLAMAIGVGELMYVARQLDGETYATFAAYLTPTVIYLICTLTLMSVGSRLQRPAQVAR
ncbi:amino acid ABC transporter permease [Paraburkholderia aspalathi]|uniref:Arginine transport system permease protein ArtQ n=1 Tax=Paraburkholderia nemoris TaxID=2793076 RepID=A0ABM8S497_9BURK|nr:MULTISPECIES: amino acid ABC transporter permease [Paraburkholderia]MBK3812883.1 amino acid ABC transporter permease [Paraburkholderia aspalathi]CAE6788060.1 Arginine transport system permease protein ArtQ [Paraburkholderia nemoris]